MVMAEEPEAQGCSITWLRQCRQADHSQSKMGQGAHSCRGPAEAHSASQLRGPAKPGPKDTHLIFSASNSLCGGRLNFFLLANQSFCGGKGAWVGREKEEGSATGKDQTHPPHP